MGSHRHGACTTQTRTTKLKHYGHKDLPHLRRRKTYNRFPEPIIKGISEICANMSEEDATKVMRSIVRVEIDATRVRLILNAPVHEIIEQHNSASLQRYTGRELMYSVIRTN